MDKIITGVSDLEDFLDKKITCLMKDNRYLVGYLRSYDRYNNLTLENTAEKLIYKNRIGYKHIGVYIIRGENIIMFSICNKKRVDEKIYLQTPFKKLLEMKIKDEEEAQ